MANSRELAEQAFSLLQDALKDSECRVAELDAELKKKRTPKDRVEEQAAVLEHRLQLAEAEKERWQRQAQQLDELLENERARTRQLKEKLSVAESGPDRAGKKEVNYWRSRQEKHDEEAGSYKQRIVELKKQLEQAEADLAEERECTVNLSEVANERREQISELTEKLDEAEERYAEAQWHLDQASRFARIVARRRTLISALISEVRSKQKSNVALKAGLDGLRKFKAKNEQQQQKQLMQIDELKTRLRSAEEKLANQKTLVEEKNESVPELEALIAEKEQSIQELESSIAAKDKAVLELEARIEAKERAVLELEGQIEAAEKSVQELEALVASKDETVVELEALSESKEKSVLELEARIEQLNRDAESGSETGVRERDAQVSDLTRTIKDQEKEIARLKDQVIGWQKKYEFLSVDTPSAYAIQVGEK